MTKSKLSLFLLIALVGSLALVSCQNDDPAHDPFSPATSTESDIVFLWPPPDIECFPDLPPVPTERLDQLDYHEFHGALPPDLGGLAQIDLPSWGKNCYVAMWVPNGALPGEAGDPMYQFSMKVPTKASYDAYRLQYGEELPLIVRLEPSGVNFLVPVVITATLMPWDPWIPGPLCPFPVGDEMEVQTGSPIPSIIESAEYWQDGNRIRVRFSAPHFSDWEIGGRDSGEEDPDPPVPE